MVCLRLRLPSKTLNTSQIELNDDWFMIVSLFDVLVCHVDLGTKRFARAPPNQPSDVGVMSHE